MSSLLWKTLYLLSGLTLFGCSGSSPSVSAPSIDASTAAVAALTQFDLDGDGMLSQSELSSSPSIVSALDKFDSDGDGEVSESEIVERVRTWQESMVAVTSVQCLVTFNGQPLSGATVRLVPEPFLGDSIKPAEGLCDSRGLALPVLSETDLPADVGVRGAHLGLYKVQIRHPDRPIPSRYRDETTLGIEVAPDTRGPALYSFDLKS